LLRSFMLLRVHARVGLGLPAEIGHLEPTCI
jgi:hypothetical protein